VARYQHRVFRLACRLTSDTDAPDVVQETFLQICTGKRLCCAIWRNCPQPKWRRC
jgi:DNA-directed RNA polymerase specialized sigma24 family protein